MSTRRTINVRGRYRDAVTTVRAAEGRTVAGQIYLHVTARQLRAASDRCCYAGDDAPVLEQLVGYSDWGPVREGGLACYGPRPGVEDVP